MSTLVKIACALALATSAFAQGNSFTDKAIPSMATAGAVAAAGTAVPASPLPENRTLVLVVGIAAVGLTFQRVFFRGRQAA